MFFPEIRTRRLVVQLQEISIQDALALAGMPEHNEHATATAFLRAAVKTVRGIEDPAHWTVQERTLAITQYLAAVAEDGPDFAVGEAGHYSDYLDGAADIQSDAALLELGAVGGDVWHIQHLTGAMAEAIERLAGELEHGNDAVKRGFTHWALGGMAAQLVCEGKEAKQPGESDYDEWLLRQMRILLTYPESAFSELYLLYFAGRQKLRHLFNIEFSDDGIVVMPKQEAAEELPPARFPAHTCTTRLARELGGKHGRARL
jgi:hypothetical protein